MKIRLGIDKYRKSIAGFLFSVIRYGTQSTKYDTYRYTFCLFLNVLLGLVILVVFPLGCKKQSTVVEIQKAVPTTKKAEQSAIVTQETTALQKQGYIYEPKGRPDPFVPLIQPAKKEKAKIAGTIESYDVTDFTLVGIAKGVERYALLVAPDNKAYTVKEGSILGLHKGKVKEIADERIIIVEYIKDYKGVLKPREIVLELRKERGEE